jgi:actin-like ATPase involved in cell morphogenesis
MRLQQPFTAKLAGTGALISINCGFQPVYVRLINETQAAVAEHVAGMAADRAVAVDDSGAGASDVEVKSSNGITLTPQGFTIGTDADLNTASDVIYVVAW